MQLNIVGGVFYQKALEVGLISWRLCEKSMLFRDIFRIRMKKIIRIAISIVEITAVDFRFDIPIQF